MRFRVIPPLTEVFSVWRDRSAAFAPAELLLSHLRLSRVFPPSDGVPL